MDLTSLGIFILGLNAYLAFELRRIERRLTGPVDQEHDDAVQQQVRSEAESFHRHLEDLQRQKHELPQTTLWAITSTPNWEQELIKKAEPLRKLIEELHGSTPDSFEVAQQVARTSMTYELAHALAELAMARQELHIRRTEWSIKKLEALGLQRQRSSKLSMIVDAERELLDLQQEILEREADLPNLKRNVMQAFQAALGPIEDRLFS